MILDWIKRKQNAMIFRAAMATITKVQQQIGCRINKGMEHQRQQLEEELLRRRIQICPPPLLLPFCQWTNNNYIRFWSNKILILNLNFYFLSAFLAKSILLSRSTKSLSCQSSKCSEYSTKFIRIIWSKTMI